MPPARRSNQPVLEKSLQRWRRLIARRLRRRPLLPFLLVATLAINPVLSIVWQSAAGFSYEAVATAFACVGCWSGQIGLLAAWLVSARRNWWGRLATGLGALLLLDVTLTQEPDSLATAATLTVAFFALQTALCLAPRLVAGRWARRPTDLRRRVHYSIGDVIVLMTVASAAAAGARFASWEAFDDEGAVFVLLPLATATTAYAIALSLRNALAASAVCLGVSLAIAYGSKFVAGDPSQVWVNLAFFVPQATIILVWMYGVRVRRRRVRRVATPPPPQGPPATAAPLKMPTPDEAEAKLDLEG